MACYFRSSNWRRPLPRSAALPPDEATAERFPLPRSVAEPMKSEPGPPMTLGSAAAAGVRLIVWCRDCRRQVEPAPAEHASRYGPQTTVLDRKARLVCGGCGSCKVDMVVSGTERQ
jgi:hypothetical protein